MPARTPEFYKNRLRQLKKENAKLVRKATSLGTKLEKEQLKSKSCYIVLKALGLPITKLPAPPDVSKPLGCHNHLTVDDQGVVWKIVSPTREGSWHHWP